MSRRNLTFSIIAFFTVCFLFGYYQSAQQQMDYSSQAPVSSKTSVAKALEYRGPLDDCLQNSSLYTRYGQNEAQCTLNYVHFFPSEKFKNTKLQKRNRAQLKLGSFNLFHLGDNQAPLKQLELMASIINRWDIVGAQEFMPLPGDAAANNLLLAQKIEGPQGSELQFPYQNWRVISPGYLLLLEELQKLDSSWAVILQPNPAGEGSTGEMAGFFYRSSQVELKEWDYCPTEKNIDIKNNQSVPNVACLVQVNESQKRLISRTAFAAYFKTGNFDFVGLTTHVRFRAADLEADRKAQLDEICLNYTETKKPCSLPVDEVGRFYEVLAVADQIQSIKEKSQDKDVIFMGDFNIQIEPKAMAYWDATLRKAPGFKVFQSEKTTVSIKSKKLASNYDHFIFNPETTQACDSRTARSYKLPFANLEKNDPVMAAVAEHLKHPKQKEWAESMTKKLSSLLKYHERSGKVRPLTEKENLELVDDYTKALERAAVNEYAAVLELMSDHLPIEMDCRADLPDHD